MKYIVVFILVATCCFDAVAQEQTARQLQETARTLVQKGDFEKAVVILERAKQKEPNNIELLRDLCFAAYLKRDFSKSVEVGKELTDKPEADPQAFQLLGLSYKAIASYKECGKLYRTALRKFPNSGVIYNEYAEVFALENNMEEAIAQWEKGIELDPVYSSNYYNAALYYVRKNNWLRAALYGEIFLNLESYSARTEEIKIQLFSAYKGLLASGTIQQLKEVKTASAFEKNILDVLAKAAAKTKVSGIDELISIRTRFMLEWIQGKQKQFPFRLFDHQQYLLSQGLFEAYNYWLFSNSLSAGVYEAWGKSYPKESDGFKTFQQSRVFKIPAGEYYFTH